MGFDEVMRGRRERCLFCEGEKGERRQKRDSQERGSGGREREREGNEREIWMRENGKEREKGEKRRQARYSSTI